MEHTKAVRYPMLDWLRGVAVTSMVVFHFTYDVMVIGGANPAWPWLLPTRVWQQSICWLFIFLAGISLQLSRSPIKGGLILGACALTVTLVTALFLPQQSVWFGVLHFLAAARLLCGLLRPLLAKIPPAVGLVASGAAFFALHRLYWRGALYGLPGFASRTGGSTLEAMPVQALADTVFAPVRIALGVPPVGFTSSDYFGLIPWLFLFLAGYFAWALVKGWPIWQKQLPVFGWVGRKSLLVYMLHQPVCYAVAMGISLLL